ncbi:hypothetical protein RRG08_055816 [Elysia crispata]|uniref:Uncharacterized protein n=1 Tax=Elysia crispata TaxID=231223 RepID=A0AAE1E722_9GAST|nr:hypothetical protein RRG08_055816 [Elysia crispata]
MHDIPGDCASRYPSYGILNGLTLLNGLALGQPLMHDIPGDCAPRYPSYGILTGLTLFDGLALGQPLMHDIPGDCFPQYPSYGILIGPSRQYFNTSVSYGGNSPPAVGYLATSKLAVANLPAVATSHLKLVSAHYLGVNCGLKFLGKSSDLWLFTTIASSNLMGG